MAKTSRNKSSKLAQRFSPPLMRALVWLVLAGLVTAAGYVGAATAWDAIAASPQFQLDLQSFALGDHPSWVKGEEMSRELRRQLAPLPDGASVFSRGVVGAVYHHLGGSPWLVQVSGVQRRLPNVLLIQASFRRPAGMAAWGGSRYMVDKEGCPLPERLFNPPSEWLGKPIPSIQDRQLNQAPPVGRAWDWPRMAVGAQLSEYLRRAGLYDRLAVAIIDVTNVGRGTADPDIILTTVSGAQIKWGASSVYGDVGLAEPAFSIPDGEKLQMLWAKLSDYPDLRGIQYLDLRFHGKVYFREETGPAPTAGGRP